MDGLRELVSTFSAEYGKSDIRTYAASTTYCMLVSVFPALILVSAILPYTALDEADMVEFLVTVAPDISSSLIEQVCREAYRTSAGIVPVTIVFMLWSAGFGMLQLTRGLNAINGVTERRNYFLLRLQGTLYALLVVALMLAVLLLQIFVSQLVEMWQNALPGVQVPEILTSGFRFVVLFVATVAIFVLIFTTVPATHKNPLAQIPGALVGAIGWEGLSLVFSLYVRYSRNLSVYYGSLTTIVVLMLWAYWCLYILLVGAFVNRFLELHVFGGAGAGAQSRAGAGGESGTGAITAANSAAVVQGSANTAAAPAAGTDADADTTAGTGAG